MLRRGLSPPRNETLIVSDSQTRRENRYNSTKFAALWRRGISGMKKKKDSQKIVVATHRKARFHYEIMETFEAGLSLAGSEVKSLRDGRATLDGCFGRESGGELFLTNFYIAPYKLASVEPPDPRRDRKLLLHKREISKILGRLQTKGLTLIPLELYFMRGWAKTSIALARGKRGPDKRDDLRRKAASQEARRSFKGRYRG